MFVFTLKQVKMFEYILFFRRRLHTAGKTV